MEAMKSFRISLVVGGMAPYEAVLACGHDGGGIWGEFEGCER